MLNELYFSARVHAVMSARAVMSISRCLAYRAQQEAPFWNGIDELPTLLSFDIVFVSPRTSPALLENIEKDGIVLMDKFQEKLSKFEQAVTRLDEVIAVYDQYKLPS